MDIFALGGMWHHNFKIQKISIWILQNLNLLEIPKLPNYKFPFAKTFPLEILPTCKISFGGVIGLNYFG